MTKTELMHQLLAELVDVVEDKRNRGQGWQSIKEEVVNCFLPGFDKVATDLEPRIAFQPITQHEGSKYLRTIHSAVNQDAAIRVDVYAVLKAFNVTCPAIAHATKKLLCAGGRGKGDVLADLKGALAAVNRAIELELERAREESRKEMDEVHQGMVDWDRRDNTEPEAEEGES